MKIFFLFCILLVWNDSKELSDKVRFEIEKFTSFLNATYRKGPNKSVVPGVIFINSKFDSTNGNFLLNQQLIKQHLDIDYFVDTTNYNYFIQFNGWTILVDETTANVVKSFVEIENFPLQSRNILFDKLLYNPKRTPWNLLHYATYRHIARIEKDTVIRKLDVGAFIKFPKPFTLEEFNKLK